MEVIIGYGDSLITTATVRKAKQKHPDRPICVGNGTIQWCEVFDHNPRISKEILPGALWVREWTGYRPYIDYTKSTPERFEWNYKFHVEPGELYLTEKELDWNDRDFVYIEPNVKADVFEGNKDWGFNKWQEVVNALPGIRFIQGRGKPLAGVEQRQTRSFRDACGLLSHASFFVGTDGGLHHAAAALGKRAIVLWSGLVPPSILGYDSHTNICKAKTFCGSLKSCTHCRSALDKITVEEIVESLRHYCS